MSFTERKKHVNELNTILSPLRSLYLKIAVDYMQSRLCPGDGWIVKLILLMCTWIKSGAASADEVQVSNFAVSNNIII